MVFQYVFQSVGMAQDWHTESEGFAQKMTDIKLVFDRLGEAEVAVRLDGSGALRIDKGAPDDIKAVVRENKEELVAILRAGEWMNKNRIRIVRLPNGQLALGYPPSVDMDALIRSASALKLHDLPLVLNDEGYQWVNYLDIAKLGTAPARRRSAVAVR